MPIDPLTGLPPVAGQGSAAGTAGAAVLTQASAAQTASGASPNLTVGQYRELAVDVTVTAVAGTTPSMTLNLDRQGTDGLWYVVWTSTALTTAGTASTTVGTGAVTNAGFGTTVRLRWTLTGTTPSFTFSASVIGK